MWLINAPPTSSAGLCLIQTLTEMKADEPPLSQLCVTFASGLKLNSEFWHNLQVVNQSGCIHCHDVDHNIQVETLLH